MYDVEWYFNCCPCLRFVSGPFISGMILWAESLFVHTRFVRQILSHGPKDWKAQAHEQYWKVIIDKKIALRKTMFQTSSDKSSSSSSASSSKSKHSKHDKSSSSPSSVSSKSEKTKFPNSKVMELINNEDFNSSSHESNSNS